MSMLFIKQKYLPYGIAFFSVGATLLVKLALEYLTGITSSFSLWLIAISVSTWYGSIISGLISVFLAALASHYFFTDPSSTLDSLEFVLFVIEGLLISTLTANFQSSKQQSDTAKIADLINLKDLLQSQHSLRHCEELYRTLTQNIPNGVVFLFDRDMRFMGAEGTELQILGLEKEEFQGKTLHETVLPETYELIEPAYRSTLQGTPMCIEIPDNNQVYLLQTFPVKDENSKIITGLVIFQNITNHKQAESKIIELNQALNKQVQELQTVEKELRQKAEDLAKINRVKDEFIAVLSHELRTPIHNLHGWAQLLLTETEMDEALKIEGLETIERNACLQVRLIDDLLDLARMQKGEMNLEMELVDLASVIRLAADTIRLSAQTKGIQIQLHLDVAVSNVLGDAIRLQQVVWNLLSNAIKFSFKNESVEIRLEQVESQAQITVIDRGRGIEAEFIPFVFERFSQHDPSTTRSAGGLGLGLAIAHYIVQLHNGNITATSAGLGKGSTFTVRLPTVTMTGRLSNDELVLGELLHDNQKIAQLQNLCILVVDDDADARMLMQTVLQSVGADVLVAASVKEALALLEQRSPALLISDISMPDEDGFTLIRQVCSRSIEQGGQIPVVSVRGASRREAMPKAIALTAFAGAKNEQRILKAGFQLFITKPIKPRELLDKIIKVLKT
ncbi:MULTISPECIES: ATP-binding protein [Calothrix]|uniref:histidine kinase n=2 Tax=Calothrix TaxID=1186 RepID=A0ABR8APN7_9CYAN|nr:MULTISPECIES: ATP-binding protein [Calothrix]MBD2200557.1 response regulator [Calothrix parietina FACHB-288]MBD2229363.1 response regulator [Calothrix anomala FACHB-343]